MYVCVCVMSITYVMYLLIQPERINPATTGGKYDQRSDVWSYGITMVREGVRTMLL